MNKDRSSIIVSMEDKLRIRDAIKEILKLLKRGEPIEKIIEYLELLASYPNLVSQVLLEDPVLGAQFFEALRKNIPRHLSELTDRILGFYMRIWLPQLLIFSVYDVLSKGLFRLPPSIALPGISKRRIELGMKRLRKSGVGGSRKLDTELIVLDNKLLNYIMMKKEILTHLYESSKSIRTHIFAGSEFVIQEGISAREYKLRLVAVLKGGESE